METISNSRSKKVDDFIKKSGVDDLIHEYQKESNIKSKIFSDVTDSQGNQYVDLVQQGGGVWGVALLGYVYVLEKTNIRFFSLAGTSAGAINTLAMAAIKDKNEEKAETILDLFLDLPLANLIDGKKEDAWYNKWEKKLISHFIKLPFFKTFLVNIAQWLLFLVVSFSLVSLTSFLFFSSKYGIIMFMSAIIIWGITLFVTLITYMRISKIATTGFGLNSGEYFHEWLKKDILSNHGIKNLEDLKTHFDKIPELKLNTLANLRNQYKVSIVSPVTTINSDRERNEEPPTHPRIAIIASDITTSNKIEFPRMWQLYYSCLKNANPADFVRASMSIPVFFETFKLRTNKDIVQWEKYLNWDAKSKIPDEILMVDGGALSNFPINIFYNPNKPVPRMPTFGVRLIENKENKINSFNGVIEYISNIVNTMKISSDSDFINKHKTIELGITNVEIGNDLSWLNFYMDNKAKQQLFRKGANAAIEFLSQFDWEKYKAERAKDFINNQIEIQQNPNNW